MKCEYRWDSPAWIIFFSDFQRSQWRVDYYYHDYYYFVLSLLRQILSPLWFAGPQSWLTPRAKWGTEKSLGLWTPTQIWGLDLPPTSWVSWLEWITKLPESQFLTSRTRKQTTTRQEEHTTTSWCDKALITVQNFSFCLGMTETLTIRKQAPWGPSCSFACKRKLLTDSPAHSKAKSKEDVIFYFSFLHEMENDLLHCSTELDVSQL